MIGQLNARQDSPRDQQDCHDHNNRVPPDTLRDVAEEARSSTGAQGTQEAEAELAENRRLPGGSSNGFAPSAEAEAPTRGSGQRGPSSKLGRARCPTVCL